MLTVFSPKFEAVKMKRLTPYNLTLTWVVEAL
jgi:hypothetical protein